MILEMQMMLSMNWMEKNCAVKELQLNMPERAPEAVAAAVAWEVDEEEEEDTMTVLAVAVVVRVVVIGDLLHP